MASLVRAEDWQGEQSLEVVAATAREQCTVVKLQSVSGIKKGRRSDWFTMSLSAHVNKVPGRHCCSCGMYISSIRGFLVYGSSTTRTTAKKMVSVLPDI